MTLKGDEEKIKEFYAFIVERHSIYIKRFVMRKEFPWTTDAILRKYKFTNVYRELDAGTIFYKEHIVPRALNEEDLLRKTIAYRMFNNPDAWRRCNFDSISSLSSRKIIELIKNYRNRQPFFNSAYITFPALKKGTDKDVYFAGYVKNLDIKSLLAKIKNAKTGKEAFGELCGLPYIKGFIAYEIYSDLLYTDLLDFDEDEFVNIGVGARPGLELIYGKLKEKELMPAIKDLQNWQAKYLPKNFNYMTLRNIEHSLCEKRKYDKIKGGGRHKLFKNHLQEKLF